MLRCRKCKGTDVHVTGAPNERSVEGVKKDVRWCECQNPTCKHGWFSRRKEATDAPRPE